jgi:hypothetical protein
MQTGEPIFARAGGRQRVGGEEEFPTRVEAEVAGGVCGASPGQPDSSLRSE